MVMDLICYENTTKLSTTTPTIRCESMTFGIDKDGQIVIVLRGAGQEMSAAISPEYFKKMVDQIILATAEC